MDTDQEYLVIGVPSYASNKGLVRVYKLKDYSLVAQYMGIANKYEKVGMNVKITQECSNPETLMPITSITIILCPQVEKSRIKRLT